MKKNKLIATEAEEQSALFAWAKYHRVCKDYLFAIPNGGSRHPIEARNLKRQGVKAGVSDIFLAYPNKGYHGLWIELKRFRNPSRLTKDQQIWLMRMRKVGYVAVHVAGWEIAKGVIEYYLDDNTVIEIDKFHV